MSVGFLLSAEEARLISKQTKQLMDEESRRELNNQLVDMATRISQVAKETGDTRVVQALVSLHPSTLLTSCDMYTTLTAAGYKVYIGSDYISSLDRWVSELVISW